MDDVEGLPEFQQLTKIMSIAGTATFIAVRYIRCASNQSEGDAIPAQSNMTFWVSRMYGDL